MNSRIEQAIANDAAARRAKPVKKPVSDLLADQPTMYGEEFTRFINFKPNDVQKGMFNDWLPSADVWGLLDKLGDDGYKLTTKFDEKGKAYAAYLMDRRKSSPVYGCMLSVKASTASLALLRLVFIHVVLAGDNWERLDVPTEDEW